MKIEVKNLPKSQVELTITVPYEDYKKAEKEAIEAISKELKVDGFRSGNIPEDVVRKNVGDTDIKAMTMEKLIPPTYSKVVKEKDIQVISQPKIDIKKQIEKEGDELTYIATVAVMPEIKMGDWKKIKVAKDKIKVEKKQVDDTINMIMDRFAEWTDVKRTAKKDDRAELDFEGFDKDGKAISNTASKNHPIVLGSKTMIPGFEDEIIGMEVGKKKEFDIKFPKEYHAKNMQGTTVKFKVTLNRLEEKKEQKLDEELIKKVSGEKQSVADFTKRVEADLLSEMQQRAQGEHDNKVVKEIVKMTKAELPEVLIKQEIEYLKKEQQQRISQQGLTWEQYLQHIKKTEEDFEKDHMKIAEDRLLARLGVTEIMKDAKIEVDDKDVDKKIADMMSKYPKDHQKQFTEHYKKDGEGYLGLKNSLAADKLIEMLTK